MKYTFERMDELRDIAVAEWQAIPRANTRDIIVDVRAYAVTVPVAEWIGRRILKALESGMVASGEVVGDAS